MYDFSTIIDRSGTGACKWERRSDYEKAHGILPMSVADMEFKAPPCVQEALEKAARHGIYKTGQKNQRTDNQYMRYRNCHGTFSSRTCF